MENRLQHALNYAKSKLPTKSPKLDKFVYVILCQSFVKIGISDRPDKRLMEMQVGCPFELKVIARYPSPNAKHDESRLHDLLVKFHVRGEWFKIPDSLIAMMVKAGTVAELFNDTP